MKTISPELYQFLQQHAQTDSDGKITHLDACCNELAQLTQTFINSISERLRLTATEEEVSDADINQIVHSMPWIDSLHAKNMIQNLRSFSTAIQAGGLLYQATLEDELSQYHINVICGKQAFLTPQNTLVHCEAYLQNGRLHFRLNPPEKPVSIHFSPDNKYVLLNNKQIQLRPWSMALYQLFTRHPQGIFLKEINNDYRGEFIKIYNNICTSDKKKQKLEELLNSPDYRETINDKISELNTELKSANVSSGFFVRQEKKKATDQPYSILYLQENEE